MRTRLRTRRASGIPCSPFGVALLPLGAALRPLFSEGECSCKTRAHRAARSRACGHAASLRGAQRRAIHFFLLLDGLLRVARNDGSGCLKIESGNRLIPFERDRARRATFFLLPLREKVARTQSVPDEGALQNERPRPLTRLRFAKAPSPARGPQGEREDHPAPTALLRQARCAAQLQPGGCDATSSGMTSLAGVVDIGGDVGIASLTRRSCVDRSCAGM
jgi:hypothetical protein